MTSRPPIHLGSGEPVLLLHPFLLSNAVWEEVARQLADTGRYEVFAPAMAGHNGGPSAGTWFLSSAVLADHVERQMDELGWDTAHIVGNSLGGWVAFELERRGRARSVTGIAPAGGWHRWSPAKFEVIAKFIMGIPLLMLAWLFGPRVLRLPFSRRLATYAISASPDGVSERELKIIIDDVAHCPAYLQLLVKALLLHGLRELAAKRRPGASSDLRKGSDHPRAQVHPAFHRAPARQPQAHGAQRRRTRADVRGAGAGHRGDHRVPRRGQPGASGRQSARELTVSLTSVRTSTPSGACHRTNTHSRAGVS